MKKIPVHLPRRRKRDDSDDNDSDDGEQNTTTTPTVPVTSATTWNKEDSTTTMSVASESVLTIKGNRGEVEVTVVIVPVLFSMLLLGVFIFCQIYKTRIKETWKQKLLQLKKRGKLNSNTDNVTKENVQVCVQNSGYSLTEKEVVVSSLPVMLPAKQTQVVVNNYSVLNRDNDAKNYLANNLNNTPEYDLLNHSKTDSSVIENTNGNFYSTSDAALNRADQESAYDKAHDENMYTRAGNQSNLYSSSNHGNIYSSTDQGNNDYTRATRGINCNKNIENQDVYYSSANHDHIYSSANQRNIDNSIGRRNGDYAY